MTRRPRYALLSRYALHSNGNILIYVLMTMVIFAFIGVTMVSLFSTSISSSATPNETRRAFYLYESGLRYAMSEMTNSDFSKSTINGLVGRTFNLGQGTFRIVNIFSPWFESIGNHSSGSNGTISVRVPEGTIPDGYLAALPTNNSAFFLVNYNYIDKGASNKIPTNTAISPITAITASSPTAINITLSSGFNAQSDEKVVFAVSPYTGVSEQILPTQNYIDLNPIAKTVFHVNGGVFEVQKRSFYYSKRDDSNLNKTTLIGVTPVPDEKNLTGTISITSSDRVILSPRNRIIYIEGKSGDVVYGNQPENSFSFPDTSTLPLDQLKPDIVVSDAANMSDIFNVRRTTASGISYATMDNADKSIDFASSTGFGNVWFKDNRLIGGESICAGGGECLLGNGIRAFFTFNWTGGNDGDGFTFSLINGTRNSNSSVGGDSKMPELLGYAGDSRRYDPISGNFIDFLGDSHGLREPKLSVEFDGFKNNSTNDLYGSDCTKIDQSRKDPDTDNIQFVFWRSNDPVGTCKPDLPLLNIGRSQSYDDNMHDATPNPSSTVRNIPTLKIDKDSFPSPLNDNWFTSPLKTWGVRVEFKKDPDTGDFSLRTYIVECELVDECATSKPIFRNTRYEYAPAAGDVYIEQSPLSASELLTDLGQDFQTFLFGFTSATHAAQQIKIKNVQLSFIRSNDPKGHDFP